MMARVMARDAGTVTARARAPLAAPPLVQEEQHTPGRLAAPEVLVVWSGDERDTRPSHDGNTNVPSVGKFDHSQVGRASAPVEPCDLGGFGAQLIQDLQGRTRRWAGLR